MRSGTSYNFIIFRGVIATIVEEDIRICGDRPRIRGTRITVQHVLENFVSVGCNLERFEETYQFIGDYPAKQALDACLVLFYDDQSIYAPFYLD